MRGGRTAPCRRWRERDPLARTRSGERRAAARRCRAHPRGVRAPAAGRRPALPELSPGGARIHVGFAIINITAAVNHPARTAECVATLDHLTEGRVEFGTGRGSSQAEWGGSVRGTAKARRAHTRESWLFAQSSPATRKCPLRIHRQLCKRPCFHDEYLQTFNRPSAHLVDTDGRGVERIDATGVWANGVHYDLDCLVFASGFEFATEFSRRCGFETNLVEAGTTIAAIVKHALDTGAEQVEVTPEAEKAWVDLIESAPQSFLGNPECTPGYYNNEGREMGRREKLNVGSYPFGPVAYFQLIDGWRTSGTFEGLTFRAALSAAAAAD